MIVFDLISINIGTRRNEKIIKQTSLNLPGEETEIQRGKMTFGKVIQGQISSLFTLELCSL